MGLFGLVWFGCGGAGGRGGWALRFFGGWGGGFHSPGLKAFQQQIL